MADPRKIAALYLAKTASDADEIQWAAKELDKANEMLGDVVLVLDSRHSGESIADVYGDVAKVTDDLRRTVSRILDKHQKTLESAAKDARRKRTARRTLKPGEGDETENLRVHRYMDSVQVTDLTNAGRRGKRVDQFTLYDLDAIRRNDLANAKFDKWLAGVLKGADYSTALRSAQQFVQEMDRLGGYRPKIETRQLKGVRVDPPQSVSKHIKMQLVDTPELTLGVEAKPTDVRFDQVTFIVDPETGKRGPYREHKVLHGTRKKREVRALYNWVVENESKLKKVRSMSEVRDMLRKGGVPYDVTYLD